MLKYIIKLLQLCYNQYKVVIIVKKAKIFLSILFLVFSFVGAFLPALFLFVAFSVSF